MTPESIKTHLEPRSISECDRPPDELQFMGQVLQHQADVFLASKDHDIVLDLAPTGTGKTRAGLSVLLHQPHSNAVYVAPTNALIEQQAQAAETFIRSSCGKLNHVVKAVSAREIRQWSSNRVGFRPGKKLNSLIRNPATIFPEVGANRPLLLVTNPDIFYYATFFSYNQKDKINLATSFYTQFSTIIFDEFHLYDAKQLVGLLFYLAYLHIFGFFQAGRRVILLTATPEPACESALAVLKDQGVRIKRIDGEVGDRPIPSQTAVQLEIRPQPDREIFLKELADEVIKRLAEHPDRNGAVILDSKVQINDLADLLKAKGLSEKFGRIHGSTPKVDREEVAQKQIILATSTVDVGFNFNRHPEPQRQNLDWLIFSARDRAAFWQRIGRVGRVLGKAQTNISSEAIAYLPEQAWEENLAEVDLQGGRDSLTQKLSEMKCLDRPFLEAYWQSEALLETARPLLILEDLLDQLPQANYVPKLFETIKVVLGGKRDWKYYQDRMKALQMAQQIANASEKDLAGDPLRWVKGQYRWAIVSAFLRSESPEDWEALRTKQKSLRDFENLLRDVPKVASMFKQFATRFSASYAPLFQFRASLFKNLQIRDPKGFLLDQSEETILDPIHLLRYYEFESNGEVIEIVDRAQATYEISFHLNYDEGDIAQFNSTQLNKLSAFQNCRIQRTLNGATSPTPLLKTLEKQLLPGVIVSTIANQGIIIRLRKWGIASYPITIACRDGSKSYTIFPGFAGIVAAALNGIKIRLMDEEAFWII
ncbi:type I-D CRISPR-associated helicase Cas3' [Microcoleus sp. FACHB-1515]|uniref:type I-D CRISPR-associated helicase Cas3' n=1 Tax=Cyanophyceae TaxID=3028117 RepID=UPI00168905B8|nr:type I-D CRISPR-associated helicase Cas3' [Microcoleus sp. FACHB-1515]MBD2093484.1 type I-D CRISPR-associated helicase Cas3' [Microcoleus sp. FACHB-1515]